MIRQPMPAILAGIAAVLLSAGAALAAPPAPIPEPAGLALLALGVVGVALVKFRRRK